MQLKCDQHSFSIHRQDASIDAKAVKGTKRCRKNDQAASQNRQNDLQLLQKGRDTIRGISNATNVSKTLVNRISMCLSRNDEEGLQKLLNPSVHTRGAPTIDCRRETMIVERLILQVSEGLQVGKTLLCQ